MIPDPTPGRPPRRPAAATTLAAGLSLLFVALLGACGDADAGDTADGEGPGAVSSARLFGEDAAGRDPDPSTSSRSPNPSAGATGSRQEPPQSRSGRVDLTDLGFTRGAVDAPIRVVEFSDFGCGYCRRFHLETYPTLAEEYIDTGEVAWKYIPFVLGMFPNAIEAAIAGECAGRQDRFAVMRDRLFEDQDEWKRSSEPYEVFKGYAGEEGLDADRFATCVDERLPADRVRANIAAGREVGVRGTPMFLINGVPVQGALPLNVFREIFGQVRASRNPAPGGP